MTAGPVLGEDARDKLAELLLLDQVAATQSGARQAASYILDTLAPHVAALVAEAERRGEARGARAERDRIAEVADREAARADIQADRVNILGHADSDLRTAWRTRAETYRRTAQVARGES